jgi:hypothetical protein
MFRWSILTWPQVAHFGWPSGVKFIYIQTLLSQDQIIANMGSGELKDLLGLAEKNIKIFEKYPDVYGFFNRASMEMLLRKISAR